MDKAGDQVFFIEATACDTQGVLKSVRGGRVNIAQPAVLELRTQWIFTYFIAINSAHCKFSDRALQKEPLLRLSTLLTRLRATISTPMVVASGLPD
jgi:hypothetical protein